MSKPQVLSNKKYSDTFQSVLMWFLGSSIRHATLLPSFYGGAESVEQQVCYLI